MKIVSIEAIPYVIPLARPFGFASGAVTEARNVLIRVTTDEGLIGVGEALPRPYTYGETQASIVAAVNELFAPALHGVDPFARQRVHATLERTVNNHTAKGAIDIALWDIIGQATSQPVHQLLGGWDHAVAASYMIGFGEPTEMVDDALEARERYGITSFKVKVGRHPWTVDLAACRLLRDALGDDVELYADANRGWRASEASEALAALAEFGFTQIEEPCPNDEMLGRRGLVAGSRLAVVGDESCTRPAEVVRNVLDGQADAICLKVARSGFTEGQAILGLCQGLGVEVRVGSQVEGALGSIAAASFAAAHRATSVRAAELTAFVWLADDLVTEPLHIVNGRAVLDERPGLGVTINAQSVDHYRIDR